jgi:beta-N-acetylhexosaminidase
VNRPDWEAPKRERSRDATANVRLRDPQRASALIVCVVLAITAAGCGAAGRRGRALASSSFAASGAPRALRRSTSTHAGDAPADTGGTSAAPGQQPAAGSPAQGSRHRAVPLARMLGQMILTRLSGAEPSPAVLRRIRLGEVGGVILFSENVPGSRSATRATISALQHAARAGGNPPLLVMTDQEGGEVRRLQWAPPALAAAQMTSATIAQAEGEATGRALRSVGVNLDLAPVADVVHVANSFLGTRSFGTNSTQVTERACSFAGGLAREGVGYTLKHFPGLGRASASTDLRPVVIDAPASAIRADYEPYLACGSSPDGIVMVSNAIYPHLSSGNAPAVLAPQTYRQELPIATDRSPVTISDDLQAGALVDQPDVPERAVAAGLDMLLFAQTEAASEMAYETLLADVRDGGIRLARIQAAYEAIFGFKAQVAPGTAG